MGEGTTESGKGAPSGRLPLVLAGLAVVQVGGLLGAAWIEAVEGGMLFGVAFATVLVIPIVAFVDVRRVRRYTAARDPAGSAWEPPLRGAGWVLGMTIPFFGPALVLAYLGRRWELGLPYPGIGAPAAGERTDWLGWPILVGAGTALATGALVLLVAIPDPAPDGNTPAQNVVIFVYLVAAPLPSLATYFDARNVADRTGGWGVGWRLLWSVSMVLWVLNIATAAGYLYRRQSRIDAVSERRERFEDLLERAEGNIGRAEDAIEAGEFDAALAALDDAAEPVEAAGTMVAGDDAFDDYRPRHLADRIEELRARADTGEERQTFEKHRARAESAVERGESALDENPAAAFEAFDEAVAAFEDAAAVAERLDSGAEAARERVDEAETRRAAAVERLEAERADPLAERAATRLEEARDATDEDGFDAAIEHLDGAADALAELGALREAYPIETTAPVDESDVEAARERVATERAQAAVDAHLAEADEREAEAAAALEDDRFDDAESAFRAAREALGDAADRAERAGLDDPGVDDRRDDLAERLRAVDDRRQEAAFREALERGDEALADARDDADRERYEAALEACARAREAFEAARDAAEAYDGADPATVAERLTTVEELRAEYTVNHLSARLTDLPDPAAVGADDPEPFEDLADSYRELIDDVAAADVDRERDLEVLRSEAARGHVGARLGALAARARAAVETFRAGEHAAARDAFEAVGETITEVRETAAEFGIEEYDDDLDAVAEACEANADAARRAVLGIEAEPTLDPVPAVLGGIATVDRASVANGGGATAAGTGGSADGDDGVTDRLQAELPEHEVLGFVGSGGNADVHRVRLADGREAALKVPTWEGTLSRNAVERFVGEAETWSKLDSHEGIVPVLDWGSSPYPWMLLEYLPASLDERVDDLPFDRRLDVLVGVCDALEYAHGRGVVHLDVKPENVLLTGGDDPKVGDWGLARVLLEHTGTPMGLTPAYSAPEQLTDDYGEVDRRTDVYQASVLAYRALTGRLPFQAERPAVLREAILGDEVPPPSSVSSCPGAMDEVLLKGLARDPAERYETAVLLRNALADLG